MKLLKKIRALFRREKLDADMAEEMREHLERRTQANLAAGMSVAEARYAARRQFGGVEQLKELSREQRGWRWLEEWRRDLRFGLRQLRKSPGFTTVALLTLALGIGVNTSMFSVLNTLLFHQPPFPEPEALVRVFRTTPSSQSGPHSPGDFTDFRAQTRSFAQVAAFSGNGYSLAEPDQPAVLLRGLDVSGDFFAALGVQPALGRWIAEEDDQPGHNQVVVLSDTVWRQRFNADPAILNRQIRLNGELITVIGVMPAGFDDPFLWGQAGAWRPLAFNAQTRQSRGGNWLGLLGRLKPGVTSAQARAELTALSENLARAYPETNARSGINLVSLVRSLQDGAARRLSWFAMGLAVCVLLIACVNLANLLFARNALRAREQAIRTALGASRAHLLRLSLTESLLLAIVGGGLGLVVCLGCNALVGARLQVAGVPGLALPIDWLVISFALIVALLSGVGFGLLPAFFASRTDVSGGLKQGGRGNSSGASHRLRHTLIVGEVALALLLLSGAGFFIRGLDRFSMQDHGWRPDNVLSAYVTLPAAKYRDDPALVAFYDRLQSRLAAIPGVEHVALARVLPFGGFQWGQRFVVEGQPLPAAGAEPMRDVNGVSPDYFATLGLPLVAGRGLTAADLTGPERTVVSESMARQIWPGESAVGKRIRHPSDVAWQEVVGVVRDIGFATNLENTASRPQTYRLFAREPGRGVAIALRSVVAPTALTESLRRAVAELDPELPVQNIRAARAVIAQSLSNYALIGQLLSGFALLGLLLAAVGIYGVISGFVAQRTNEIGIRMALGAQLADVLHLVLGQGLKLTLVGAGLGLAGAAGIARLLSAIMPALPTPEASTAAGLTLLLLAIGLLACLIPARRAALVDPVTALRGD